MSAICGIVRFDGKPVESEELETMVESSPYRGPDGVGYHIRENAGFAHLAFHVTPESVHEKQPLVSEDGRFVLVADVRLDNRDELFSKLEIHNDADHVITDPDLILLAWHKWGTACVEHFLGDFVFSVWDSRAKKLFLARDPLGAYCVHYYRVASHFIFASETSAILDLPFVEPIINEDVVLREIEFLPRNHEETFFESIFYMPPAHCMEVSPAGNRKWRYWDIDPEFQTSYDNDNEYADHLLELVDRETASRLRCIGPVGISLSGGHDSTLLAASAARQLPGTGLSQSRLMSFSYVFDQLKECDERKWIHPVVEKYNMDARYILADDLWTFRHLAQQPVAKDYLWTNCFVNLPLSVATAAQRAGCRLLLNGEFGDVLFSGPNLTVADLLGQARLGNLLSYLKNNLAEFNWKQDLLFHGIGPYAPKWAQKIYRRLFTDQTNIYIAGLAGQKKRKAISLRKNQQQLPAPAQLAPGAKRRYGSLLNASWAQGFAAVRAAGYNRFGIESSSPFYSRKIVEFILSVPSERISKPGNNRFLQSDTMQKVLPRIVTDRKLKTSFTELLKRGLVEKESDTLTALLQDPMIVQQGWIDQGWLEQQLIKGENLDDSGYPLTHCVHLELWLRAVDRATQKKQRWSVSEPPFV